MLLENKHRAEHHSVINTSPRHSIRHQLQSCTTTAKAKGASAHPIIVMIRERMQTFVALQVKIRAKLQELFHGP